MSGDLLQQLYACRDEWPPIPNLTGISSKHSLTRSSLLVILLVDMDALGNLGSTLRVVPGSQDDSGVELSVPLVLVLLQVSVKLML